MTWTCWCYGATGLQSLAGRASCEVGHSRMWVAIPRHTEAPGTPRHHKQRFLDYKDHRAKQYIVLHSLCIHYKWTNVMKVKDKFCPQVTFHTHVFDIFM